MNFALFFVLTFATVFIGSATFINEDEPLALPKVLAITFGGIFNLAAFGILFPSEGFQLFAGWIPTAIAFAAGYFLRTKLLKSAQKVKVQKETK